MEATLAYPGSVSQSSAKPSAWLRLFPSFTDVAFLLPIWFLFSVLQGSRTLLADGDTGWHIRTGDWILQHGTVPHQDIFSFTKFGQPWFAWEWGWDVLASLIHTRWGLPGIVFVNTILIGLISALLFRLVRRHTTNYVLALAISCTAMIGSSFHWLARPHLLSWLFVLLFLDVIDRFENGNDRVLWCLPVLTLLWVNLHGSFFIGISFLFTYGIVESFRLLVTTTNGRTSLAKFARPRSYLLCGFLCAVASFVNPYGWHLHQHLFAYLCDSKQLDDISEFGSTNFHSVLGKFYEFFFLLGPCVAFRCVKQGKGPQAALLLLWAHLSLCVVRNVPIFLLLAAAPTAAFLDYLFRRLSDGDFAGWIRSAARCAKDMGNDFSTFETTGRVHVVSAAGIAVVAVLLGLPARSSALTEDFDPRDFPVHAASILAGDSNAKIFTHDQWGDYLIYRFYPHMRVFVDGRSDFYGAAFSKRWADARRGHYDWENELSRFSIDTVLLRTEDPLASVLKQSPAWMPVLDDGVAIVFRASKTKVSSGLNSGRKHL